MTDITHNKIKLLYWAIYTSIHSSKNNPFYSIDIPLIYIVKDEQLMY